MEAIHYNQMDFPRAVQSGELILCEEEVMSEEHGEHGEVGR